MFNRSKLGLKVYQALKEPYFSPSLNFQSLQNINQNNLSSNTRRAFLKTKKLPMVNSKKSSLKVLLSSVFWGKHSKKLLLLMTTSVRVNFLEKKITLK